MQKWLEPGRGKGSGGGANKISRILQVAFRTIGQEALRFGKIDTFMALTMHRNASETALNTGNGLALIPL